MEMQAETVVAMITIVVTPDFVCSNSEIYYHVRYPRLYFIEVLENYGGRKP